MPVSERDQEPEVGLVLAQGKTDPPDQLTPPGRRHQPPGGERAACLADDLIVHRRIGPDDPAQGLAGCRVERRQLASPRVFNPFGVAGATAQFAQLQPAQNIVDHRRLPSDISSIRPRSCSSILPNGSRAGTNARLIRHGGTRRMKQNIENEFSLSRSECRGSSGSAELRRFVRPSFLSSIVRQGACAGSSE